MHSVLACRLATTRLPSLALQQRNSRQIKAPKALPPFKLCLGDERIKPNDQHQRLELSKWAGPDKDRWAQLLEEATEELKSPDTTVQAEAALKLATLTTNTLALSQLRANFAEHGTIPALADALNSSSWGVMFFALTILTCVASTDKMIAADIPVTVYPSLVDILQEATEIDDEAWRTRVQAGAAVLAGEVAVFQSPGAAALDVVPLLVDLLDVRNKDNTVCIGAALSLMQLGVSGPVLLQAVEQSGALQKLYPWIASGESDLMLAALKAISGLGEYLLGEKKFEEM